MAGCDGGEDYHHHERIHWGSVVWALTSCVSVGAIGVVVTKKIQAFNSDQDIHEAFIDNEQAWSSWEQVNNLQKEEENLFKRSLILS